MVTRGFPDPSPPPPPVVAGTQPHFPAEDFEWYYVKCLKMEESICQQDGLWEVARGTHSGTGAGRPRPDVSSLA